MASARGFEMPRMRARTFLLAMGLLVAVCLSAGLAMRASLTDVNGNVGELDSMSFLPSPATPGMIGLYTSQDILRELERSGLDAGELTLEESQDLLTLAMDNVEEIAPVIVTGRFTGERTYVYEAFRCAIEVTGVVKGEGVTVGERISVYDPYSIREPSLYTDSGGMFSAERVVAVTSDDYTGGSAPLRAGQEYLFFLEPKTFPEGMEPPPGGATYILARHPYARIPLDVVDHPERVYVIELDELETVERAWGVEYVMPEMTFAEACAYDMFVQGPATAELYLATCRGILSRVLGT